MNEKHCVQSLLASSTHDMRNVLAVIRESTGLVQDILRFGDDLPNKERLLQALDEVQKQISKGALLTESVDCLAQNSTEHEASTCDGNKIAQAFCCMIARHAKAAHICCTATTAAQPVWINQHALTVLQSLLALFEHCAAAQGALNLHFKAARHEGKSGFYVTAQGDAAALAALDTGANIQALPPHWATSLLPWREQDKQRFWLALDL
jgi:hypothetical protein